MKTSKNKTLKILLFVFGGIFIFLVLSALGIWYLFNLLGGRYMMSREAPPEIREARILTGADLLTKSNFFQREDLKFIDTLREAAKVKDEQQRQKQINSRVGQSFDRFEDIVIGELDGQKGTDVALVGKTGAHIFDLNGELKSFTQFEFETFKVKVGWFESEQFRNHFEDVQVIDLENDGVCEFLVNGLTDGAAIFDHNGKLVWKYGARDLDLNKVWKSIEERETDKTPYVISAAAGDVNGDGNSEVFVMTAYEGLRAFDATGGGEIWFQPLENFYSDLKVLDVTGDGKPDLVEKNRRDIIFRDGKGEAYQQTEIIDYYGDLTLCLNQDGKKPHLIDDSNDKFKVMDFQGIPILEASAPLSRIKLNKASRVGEAFDPEFPDEEDLAFPKATWVRLKKGQPKYLAVVGRFIGLSRSMLYIYGEKGNLVYQEILPEESFSIAALPLEGGAESILVGGEKTVWRYNLN